jgi:mRNA interferase MazF
MKRGEVWVANLNSNRGSEVEKIRPVLVLQNNVLTDCGFPTVVVLPMTTQVRKDISTLRISVAARDKLQEDCQIMIDQPRTLDRKRIGQGPLTRLTHSEMEATEKSLMAVLGMM